jgi:hypothetical protein
MTILTVQKNIKRNTVSLVLSFRAAFYISLGYKYVFTEGTIGFYNKTIRVTKLDPTQWVNPNRLESEMIQKKRVEYESTWPV